jgi:hypothetical protein
MPARARPLRGVVVSFHRGNEVMDWQAAPTPERALKVALLMLAKLDDLRDGDRLTVEETK